MLESLVLDQGVERETRRRAVENLGVMGGHVDESASSAAAPGERVHVVHDSPSGRAIRPIAWSGEHPVVTRATAQTHAPERHAGSCGDAPARRRAGSPHSSTRAARGARWWPEERTRHLPPSTTRRRFAGSTTES